MASNFPIGPLTAIAIADAYGCGFEFLPAFDKRWPQMQYKQHTMWPGLPAGYYSDDTQLTLAVAEWMLHGRYSKYDLDSMLVRVYERDIRGGSPRMEEALHSVMSKKKMSLTDALIEKTDGSGAAMRSSLLAARHQNISLLLAETADLASITHGGDGVVAAQAAALLALFLGWQNIPKTKLGAEVSRVLRVSEIINDDRFTVTAQPTKRSHKGVDCVQAAIWVLQESSTLSEILQNTIAMGGDTDTVAVIAMGAAWCSEQYAHDLPQHLWWDLENGPYGRSYLRKVELELFEKYYKDPATNGKRGLRTE